MTHQSPESQVPPAQGGHYRPGTYPVQHNAQQSTFEQYRGSQPQASQPQPHMPTQQPWPYSPASAPQAQQLPQQPTSASPAPQQSPPPVPQQSGYVLGIDLGTSHTVAVIRWPDGRARPLLVDGAPVMPSAVFMDESGHIHVGRDAQRLAQTDPARFEPNPKQRIADSTVWLGDREVPVTALLAAVLANVASKAVEAVGHLPPAVLTCPAKWGQQRKSMLEEAAAKAGFPPVRLVPEPIAAAHYFAEVMQHPIPIGNSIAVFDFGGGTLDVAVVRHQSDGTFQVQSDGGLEDLGGLDIDAALVQFLGRTISSSVPQVWSQLTQPSTGQDRRNRRLFWDDVRGAKEMLSRTTVAPVPVPGVEASLHLTRDELEQLANPLVARAVDETNRVIGQVGITAEQMAGLFLVGGASRIPLVSRLLHARLGIAPTVLEQPELPVAEGSLAAAFPLGATNSVPPTQQVLAATRPIPHTGDPVEDGAEPKPKKPWYREKPVWIAAVAALLVFSLLGWWLLHDPYPQYDMDEMTQVGKPVPFPHAGDSQPTVYSGKIFDNTAYFASDSDDGVYVTAIDMTSGKKKWVSDKIDSNLFEGLEGGNGILYGVYSNTSDIKATFIDVETGDLKKTVAMDDTESEPTVVGDKLVSIDTGGGKVVGYNADGSQAWTSKVKDIAGGGGVENWDSYVEPAGVTGSEASDRAFAYDTEGKVSIIDTQSGEVVKSKKLGIASAYFGYDDKIITASDEDKPVVSTYDTKTLEESSTFRVEDASAPSGFQVCGETRVCMLNEREKGVAVDVLDIGENEAGPRWQSPADANIVDVEVAGESLAVTQDDSGPSTKLYDENFEVLGKDQKNTFHRVDSGSFLDYPQGDESTSTTEGSYPFVGLGARDGESYQLGSQKVVSECVASDAYIACDTEDGYTTWQYRA